VQPCELYPNSKEAKQQLFAAAAALYYLTGDTKYRRDVDKWWQTEELFKNNWNSVYPQGLTILALTPNPGKYADYLKESVQKWVDCSSGQKTDLCECAPPICSCGKSSCKLCYRSVCLFALANIA
jgi:hypothetical protein